MSRVDYSKIALTESKKKRNIFKAHEIKSINNDNPFELSFVLSISLQ